MGLAPHRVGVRVTGAGVQHRCVTAVVDDEVEVDAGAYRPGPSPIKRGEPPSVAVCDPHTATDGGSPRSTDNTTYSLRSGLLWDGLDISISLHQTQPRLNLPGYCAR